MAIRKTAWLDPGIRGAGVSVFHDAVLNRAAFVHNPVEAGSDVRAAVELARAVAAWVGPEEIQELAAFGFERPQMYDDAPGRRKRKGDQNDLPSLYGVACAVGALLPPWVELLTWYPREWKDTLRADAMTQRVWGKLTDEERARVKLLSSTYRGAAFTNRGDKDHNTIDSVGMGLKCVGRLDRVRVLPA